MDHSLLAFNTAYPILTFNRRRSVLTLAWIALCQPNRSVEHL